jgi:hypothetical protein
MTHFGIQDGDEYTVVVYQNKGALGEIVIHAVSFEEVACQVYTDDREALLTLNEVIKVAYSTLGYHLEKPRLKELIETRIAQLRKEIEEGQEDDPPAPLSDIPF